jgi:hypothetical protein
LAGLPKSSGAERLRSIRNSAATVSATFSAPALAGQFAPGGAFADERNGQILAALAACRSNDDAAAREGAIVARVHGDPHLADQAIAVVPRLGADEETDIDNDLATVYAELGLRARRKARTISLAINFAARALQTGCNCLLAGLIVWRLPAAAAKGGARTTPQAG